MATVKIDLEAPGGIVVDLEKDGHRLRLVWSNENARLAIADLDTGESGVRTIELGKAHRITQEGSAQLFQRYDREVAFGAMVLEQTLTDLGLREYAYTVHRRTKPSSLRGGAALTPNSGDSPNLVVTPKYPAYPAPDPGDGGGTCGPSCNGPIVDPGSYSVATSRSLCCNAATQATNNACSNSFCWGCCRILGCDAQCLGTGDYFCGCSAEGQACSAPVC